MTTLPNHRAAAVGFAAIAMVASACASTAADTTTTSTTVEPSTTTTATTLAETTTTAPLETVAVSAVGEDIPAELLVALGDTLSWRVDQRNTTPPIPEGLAGPLLELDLDLPDTVVLTANVVDLEGGSVAILVGPTGDVYAAADEGTGWQIVGVDAAKGGAWFGGEPRLVLVLGSDARPGQNQQRYRADSVHLLAARASDGTGTILGFPRDSYVPSPFGSMKLSSVMSGRGPEVITDVVGDE
ncbi:MAG: hypothetical protein ACE1Z9_04085, partial [Acidimicrobiia bacterium]